MAEKVLQTKIALLYKSYAEWNNIQSTYIPLKGEVCFCEVPASTGAVASEPAILFKVGNGVDTFAALPWASAKAADVYAWAKKENLEWTDFTDNLKEAIKKYVGGEEVDTQYRIVSDGNFKWKLQKSTDGETWVDAEGAIDVTNLDARIATNAANIDKKVDKEIAGTNGTAYIFNERDGGGARFVNKDGTESFVGVNDGGKDGLAAQIYVDRQNASGKWEGAKIDVTNAGAYYTVGDKSFAERAVEENEIATKKDIAAIELPEYTITKEADPGDYAAIYHLTKDGVSVGEAINIAKDQLLKSVEVKICTEKDVPISGLVVGDKYLDFTFIVEKGEEAHTYIAIKDMVKPYTAGNGIVITAENAITFDPDVLATVDYVDGSISDTILYIDQQDAAEHAGRVAGDNLLSARIDKKVEKEVEGANGEAYIFNETDGGGAKFVHKDGSESFVGVNDGGEDGLMAQIYADKLVGGKWQGAKLDVTNDGMYYTVGDKSFTERAVAENELATKGNVEAAVNALDTSLAAIAKTGNVNDLVQSEGDILILDCNF